MSLIKTHILDPVNYIENRRAEFRLDEGTLYMANLKLVNIGFTSNDVASNINGLVGPLCVIKKLSLLDGNVEIDTVNEYGLLQAFRNHNHSNQMNGNLTQVLYKNDQGFRCFNEDGDDQIVSYTSTSKLTPATDADDTPKTYLDLPSVFPILQKLGMVHTGLFKRFRVVVEYDTDKTSWQPVSVSTSQATIQPAMVVQEVLDTEEANKWLSTFQSLEYMSMEHEQVVLETNNAPSAGDPEAKQTKQFKFNGVQNKVINRLLVAKTGDYGHKNLAGKFHSMPQKDQVFNFIVNGSQLYPRNGISEDMQRLGVLYDSWGQCNSLAGGHTGGLVNNELFDDTNKRTENMDYIGVSINNRVNELLMDYERTGLYDSTNPNLSNLWSQELRFNLFTEVAKTIKKSGSGYVISYN